MKTLLFKAYMSFMSCSIPSCHVEVIPYSKKVEKALDNIILRYCRWALGVPKTTNSLRTVYKHGFEKTKLSLETRKVG